MTEKKVGYRITAQVRVCADVPAARHSEPEKGSARWYLRRDITYIIEKYLKQKYPCDISEYVVVEVDKIGME
jgi:hypothetical protein